MSKVKEAVLAIFFTLFALSTFAQTGSVRGRIIDAKTKKPLTFKVKRNVYYRSYWKRSVGFKRKSDRRSRCYSGMLIGHVHSQ